MRELNIEEICALIDHTNLKPQAIPEDIMELCREAVQFSFQAVCVNPANVKIAADQLKNSKVQVCSVIGFPLGASTSGVKVFETEEAVRNGAGEVDMVINIGAIKAGNDFYVREEISRVIKAARSALVKVIIEAYLLNDEEKERACRIAVDAGAGFVKTSTGFARGGAAVKDVELMRRVVGSGTGVKAAGGIKDLKTLLTMVDAGASRVGTSSGVKIISELL